MQLEDVVTNRWSLPSAVIVVDLEDRKTSGDGYAAKDTIVKDDL